MVPDYTKTWSAPDDRPTPKTEQDFRNLREWSRKKAIEMAVKRYFDGVKGARNMRYFWNNGKKNISEKVYQDLLTSQKTELGRSLSKLLRKGDTIPIPPQD